MSNLSFSKQLLLKKAMELSKKYGGSIDDTKYIEYIVSQFEDKEIDIKIAVYLLNAFYNGCTESEITNFDDKIITAVKLVIDNENAENSFINKVKEDKLARQLKIIDLQEQLKFYKKLNRDFSAIENKITKQLYFLQN